MGDYLRDRFPLAGTSTAYMDGTSVYNLVRFDQPGIIAPVVLSHEQAEAFCAAVRAARAEAWDEGREAGVNDQVNWDGYYGYPPGYERHENPYRKGGAS